MAANATGVGVRVNASPVSTRLDLFAALRRFGFAAWRTEYVIPALAAGLILALVPIALSLASHGRDAAILDMAARVDLLAEVAAAEMRRVAADAPKAGMLAGLADRLPAAMRDGATSFVLSDETGTVISAEPSDARLSGRLADILGQAHPLVILVDRAGAMSVTLADGRPAVAAVRNVRGGQVAAIQPISRGALLEPWATAPCALGLAALAGLAGLGATCMRQTRRSRVACAASERARQRIDTSLACGRSGVWDWDVSRGRIYWSASMYDLLGYPRQGEYLPIGTINEMIHPADDDFCAMAEKIALADTGHLDHEFRVRTACGGWMWLRARAEVAPDPGDGTRHLVGIAMDVTDERVFAERHATADMRLRDAVEAISEAFVLWDAENRLVLCNSKFRNLHGLPDEVAVAGATYAAIMEAARPPVIEHQLARDNPHPSGSRTLEAQLSDGRWLHINERRTKDGGFVSVGTDITQMKRHERRLVDSEHRLIATVKDLQRSRRALQTQAQQLADLAERNLEANRAKTDFLAKMSHELRTPLNAVIGFAEIMQHQMFGALGSPRYLDYASDIRASGHFLLSIIDDILQMSRIEAGQLGLSIAPVSVHAAVESAIGGIRSKAAAKHLTISAACDEDVVVQADRRALDQILVHLLQNAAKFTPEGGAIRVRVRPAAGSLNIFVEDSGIGIPRHFLPRLGRPFEQVEPEFNRANGGSGLGLAISKALTEMHGGTLRIRSEEGVGTAVLVHLPPQQVVANDRVPGDLSGLGSRQPFLIAAE